MLSRTKRHHFVTLVNLVLSREKLIKFLLGTFQNSRSLKRIFFIMQDNRISLISSSLIFSLPLVLSHSFTVFIIMFSLSC